MKKTSVNTGKTLKMLSLVIGLGAMPLLLGVTDVENNITVKE